MQDPYAVNVLPSSAVAPAMTHASPEEVVDIMSRLDLSEHTGLKLFEEIVEVLDGASSYLQHIKLLTRGVFRHDARAGQFLDRWAESGWCSEMTSNYGLFPACLRL